MQAFSGSSLAAPPVADHKEHVIDAMRGFAALLVAYFHCRQVVWVGMQSFHHAYGHALSPGVIAGNIDRIETIIFFRNHWAISSYRK